MDCVLRGTLYHCPSTEAVVQVDYYDPLCGYVAGRVVVVGIPYCFAPVTGFSLGASCCCLAVL